MPDELEQRTQDLEKRVFDILKKALAGFSDILCDTRLPPIDAKGYFADIQVRQQHLDAIAYEVDTNWPEVCEVRGSVSYSDGPRFDIHIDPFSREGQRRHWPLADEIESIVGKGFHYFFLPKMEHSPFSSEIIVYKRSPVSPK